MTGKETSIMQTESVPSNGAGPARAHYPQTDVLGREPRSPRTLPELLAMFEEAEERENPDVVLSLNALTVNERGLVEVPRQGAFDFTDWSRRQCASLLGLKWDRWFENASGAERSEELNRRLRRATSSVRLRTSRPGEGVSDIDPHASGVLRAFVSPGYSAVRDSVLARRLVTALAGNEDEFRLTRWNLTDRTATYVVRLGHAYRKGGAGNVGDVWGGVLVRNSGVGFASLLLTLHLTRLVCLNGMVAPLPDATLMRRRHRGIEEGNVAKLLDAKLHDLPGRLLEGQRRLERAEQVGVDDIEGTLRVFLVEAKLPQRLLPPILAAYAKEPLPTAFGISQAVTLAAQALPPEERLDLEEAAGRYLAATVVEA